MVYDMVFLVTLPLYFVKRRMKDAAMILLYDMVLKGIKYVTANSIDENAYN